MAAGDPGLRIADPLGMMPTGELAKRIQNTKSTKGGTAGTSRYRLDRCIARGGMGAVYLGVQRGAGGFERPVAIKRTHAHLLETPEMRELILQEARHASAVRHPNVVSIDDVEEIDDELLLVMDYVDGGSLAQLAKGGPIPLGVTLSIILDACAGLHAIHSAMSRDGRALGLVHRDVSPQNILVGLDGVARITDFGIAKGVGDPRRTSQTSRRGKFGYMAPEYLVSGEISAASDIFALGVVLWEAIAGRRLFGGDSNMDSICLSIQAEVPSLHLIDPRISPKIDAILRKALAREPRERFSSMAAFGQRLEAATLELVANRQDVANHVRASGDVRPMLGAATGISLRPAPARISSLAPSESNLYDETEVRVDVPRLSDLVAAMPAFPRPPARPAIVNATDTLSMAEFEAALDAVPRLSDLVPDELPVTRALPAPPRLPSPIPDVRARGKHRAFRLDEEPAEPAPPPALRPVVVVKPSVLARLGLAAFCIGLLSSTGALAYAGLSRDGRSPVTVATAQLPRP